MSWDQRRVSEKGPEISNLKKAVLDQSSRGRTPEQIAEAKDVPVKLVEVLLLNGKSAVQQQTVADVLKDSTDLGILPISVKPPPTTWWTSRRYRKTPASAEAFYVLL